MRVKESLSGGNCALRNCIRPVSGTIRTELVHSKRHHFLAKLNHERGGKCFPHSSPNRKHFLKVPRYGYAFLEPNPETLPKHSVGTLSFLNQPQRGTISTGHTCVRLRDVPRVKSYKLQAPHFLLTRSCVFIDSSMFQQQIVVESRPIVSSHWQLLLAPGCQRPTRTGRKKYKVY